MLVAEVEVENQVVAALLVLVVQAVVVEVE
jgi:hypothetical protein